MCELENVIRVTRRERQLIFPLSRALKDRRSGTTIYKRRLSLRGILKIGKKEKRKKKKKKNPLLIKQSERFVKHRISPLIEKRELNAQGMFADYWGI
jgi:hypothetical protein